MAEATEQASTSDEQVLTSDTFKDYLAVASFMLTAGALTFDVGYFAGVDLNFFTFFSISEQILFALEALPLVFLMMFVGVMLGYFFADEELPLSISRQ